MENKPVKNLYTVKPFELEPGDVLLAVVKLMVTHEKDAMGRPLYRLYRCVYPADTDTMYQEDVPQGSSISESEEAIVNELFPVVANAGMRSR